jgi:hypothetical protein
LQDRAAKQIENLSMQRLARSRIESKSRRDRMDAEFHNGASKA